MGSWFFSSSLNLLTLLLKSIVLKLHQVTIHTRIRPATPNIPPHSNAYRNKVLLTVNNNRMQIGCNREDHKRGPVELSPVEKSSSFSH